MFNDAVENIRQLVGIHGSQGCSLAIVLDAVRAWILPSLHISPRSPAEAAILGIVRADESIRCEWMVGGKSSRPPTDWVERASLHDDVSIHSNMRLCASRTLQAHACGMPLDAFIRPATWVALDVLSEHLVEGASREDIRLACTAQNCGASYHLAIASLLEVQVMISATVIVPHTGFRTKYFLRVSAPSVTLTHLHGFLPSWLAAKRTQWLHQNSVADSKDPLPAPLAFPDDDDEVDFDDVSPQPYPNGSCADAIAVEDEVILRMVQGYPQGLTISQLALLLHKYYGLPWKQKAYRTSAQPLQVQCDNMASLQVVTYPPDDNRWPTIHVRRSVGLTPWVEQTEGGKPPPRPVPIDPKRALPYQLLELATTQPVPMELTRSVLQFRHLKNLVTTVKALSTTSQFSESVEVTSKRSDTSKTFTVLLQPKQSMNKLTASAGVSSWAKSVLLEALQQRQDGVLVLKTMEESLDNHTISRLLIPLRKDGLIVTSGVQLPGKPRLGLILDAAKVVSEEAKIAAAQEYFDKKTIKVRGKRRQATVTYAPLAKRAPAPPAKGKLSVKGPTAASIAEVGRKVRGSDVERVEKLSASYLAIGNGSAPNHTARCWRLHLELWHIARQLATPTVTAAASSTSIVVTLGALMERMTLSTFAVVCGVSTTDLGTAMEASPCAWGTPLRHLPVNMRAICKGPNAWHTAALVLATLESHGAVSISSRDALQALSATVRIQLHPHIVTPDDGVTWPIASNDPTMILLQVGMYWGTVVAQEHFTSLPNIRQKRLGVLQSVLHEMRPGVPTLAEVLSIARLMRVDFSIMAQYATRSNDERDFPDVHIGSRRGRTTSLKTPLVVGRARIKRHADHGIKSSELRMLLGPRTGPTSPTTLDDDPEYHNSLMDDVSDVSDAQDEPEESDGDENVAPLSGGGTMHQRTLHRLPKRLIIQPAHLEGIIRRACLEDSWELTLCRIQRIAANNEDVQTFVTRTRHMLQQVRMRCIQEAPQAEDEGSMRARNRQARMAALDGLFAPTTVNPANTSMHHISAHSLINPPHHDEDLVAATNLLEEHATLADAIRSITYSHADAITVETRDAMLAQFDPAVVPAVCRAMRHVHPLAFAVGKGSERSWSASRMHRHIIASSMASTKCHFAAPVLAESIVAQQAHHLADLRSPRLHTAEDDGSAVSHVTSLLQQPLTSTLGGCSHEVPLAQLSFPKDWVEGSDTARRKRERSDEQLRVEDEAKGDLRMRDPTRYALCRLGESGSGLHVGDNDRHMMAPSWMTGSLRHPDGTINTPMLAVQCTQIRSYLLRRPGCRHDAVIEWLIKDGVVSEVTASNLVDELMALSCIIKRHEGGGLTVRHPLSRLPMQPMKRSRSDSTTDMNARRGSLWWNVSGRLDTVTAHPLRLLLLNEVQTASGQSY